MTFLGTQLLQHQHWLGMPPVHTVFIPLMCWSSSISNHCPGSIAFQKVSRLPVDCMSQWSKLCCAKRWAARACLRQHVGFGRLWRWPSSYHKVAYCTALHAPALQPHLCICWPPLPHVPVRLTAEPIHLPLDFLLPGSAHCCMSASHPLRHTAGPIHLPPDPHLPGSQLPCPPAQQQCQCCTRTVRRLLHRLQPELLHPASVPAVCCGHGLLRQRGARHRLVLGPAGHGLHAACPGEPGGSMGPLF